MTPIRSFRHLVEFDKFRSMAIISRVFDDGSKVLYVELPISTTKGESIEKVFRRCAQRIGEDIVLDSPDARSILGIE